MDPFTHTLFGTALADSGLRHRSALATATLILGANLPDIDFVTYFVDGDLALWARRGWTHGVLALVVLPMLLTGLMLAWDRWVRRRRHPDAKPADPKVLWLLAVLGVCSHPALDWLNTYGVRLLMPFDGRWFYGDVLFIIEPLLWLTLGGAVFLCHSRGLRVRVAWVILALLMSLVVLGGSPGIGIKVIWIGGLLTLGVVRSLRWGHDLETSPWPARAALAVFVLYVGGLMAGDVVAERAVRDHWRALDEQQGVEDLMVGPLPGNPFRRDVIVVAGADYHFFTHDWRRSPRVVAADPSRLPRLVAGADPTVDVALVAPCLRGMANWMRFPVAHIEPLEGGEHRVMLLDARYTRRPTTAFGGAGVLVDTDRQPVCHPP